MEVFLPCLIYTVIFYFLTINIWREGSRHKKSFLYDPFARFVLVLSFIMGSLCLCGVIIGLFHMIGYCK